MWGGLLRTFEGVSGAVAHYSLGLLNAGTAGVSSGVMHQTGVAQRLPSAGRKLRFRGGGPLRMAGASRSAAMGCKSDRARPAGLFPSQHSRDKKGFGGVSVRGVGRWRVCQLRRSLRRVSRPFAAGLA
jgi:hypothetical protein